MSFEESLTRLEEIVDAVENRETGLESAINLYKEGLKLVKSCGDMLGKYESEITELVRDADGSYTEKPFNIDE